MDNHRDYINQFCRICKGSADDHNSENKEEDMEEDVMENILEASLPKPS